jgi:hypothetical protein
MEEKREEKGKKKGRKSQFTVWIWRLMDNCEEG